MSAVIEAGPDRVLPGSRWRWPLVALALVLAAILALYWNTAVAMVGVWNGSETFAHCFLVLPISLWLVWRDRARVLALSPQPQPWLLAVLAVFAALWLLGDLASVNAATQFALVAMLVSAVPAVLGLRVGRAVAFPLLFLFFMVPLGDFMLPKFMEWTANFTVMAIQLSGVPVYREGLNFVIPSGSWSVVEACSGIRYMIASFMVGSLFAYLNYRTLRRRLIFCGVAILVPLVANWVRAYMIVMLGHISNNKLAVGVDHLIYGWVFFGVIIGLMFLIGARWAELPVSAGAAPSLDPTPPPAAAPGAVAAMALAALLVAALPHGVNWRLEQGATQGVAAPLALPTLAGATAAEGTVPFQPVFHNPTATALRSYRMEDGVVFVHVAFYRNQTYGRKLVSSQNFLVASEDKNWRRSSGSIVTHTASGGSQQWRSAELVEGHLALGVQRVQRLDVRQAYWVDGQLTASDSRAAIAGLLARLQGRGDDGFAITLYTQGEAAQDTGARLDRFIARHLATIESELAAFSARR